MYQKLVAQGADPVHLAVLYVNGDQLIGRPLRNSGEGPSLYTGPLSNATFLLENPKRIMALRQMSPEGLKLQYLIGELDFVANGIVYVTPTIGYWLYDVDDESQMGVLELYTQYLEKHTEMKAKAAGLHLPTRSLLK